MNTFRTLLAAASLSLLAACGGQGDDAAGDAVADQAEATADNMEQQAEAMDAQGMDAAADQMEAQAEAVEEAGEAREEAIDEADINADAMATTPAQ